MQLKNPKKPGWQQLDRCPQRHARLLVGEMLVSRFNFLLRNLNAVVAVVATVEGHGGHHHA
jgi:hypothetical protein